MQKSKELQDIALCPFCQQRSQIFWQEQAVWKCTHCQLVFRQGPHSPESIGKYYQKGWQENYNDPQIVGGTDLALAQVYTNLLLKHFQKQDFRGQTILEFGAGKGTMMYALAEAGATVYGIDPYGSAYLQSQGLNAVASLEELPNGLHFDGIVTIQVIEHMLEPWLVLKELKEKLVSSGWIYISTINANSLNARLNGAQWREVQNPSHFYFFNNFSLESIILETGYTICQRLNGYINYPHYPLIRKLLSYSLQQLSLGGELSYLAWK